MSAEDITCDECYTRERREGEKRCSSSEEEITNFGVLGKGGSRVLNNSRYLLLII